LNIKVCFVFLYNFCLKKFSFEGKLSEMWSRMYSDLHVTHPLYLSDFNGAWIFSTDFRKITNIKFHENPSSGNRVVPRVQTDGWTDMTKLIFAFRNFANALEKEMMLSITQKRNLRLLGQMLFSYRNCCDVYGPVPLLCPTANVVWPTLVHFRVRSYSQCLRDVVNCKMAAPRKWLS
jgi:hypothetical protein